jgi:hypothetical protein
MLCDILIKCSHSDCFVRAVNLVSDLRLYSGFQNLCNPKIINFYWRQRFVCCILGHDTSTVSSGRLPRFRNQFSCSSAQSRGFSQTFTCYQLVRLSWHCNRNDSSVANWQQHWLATCATVLSRYRRRERHSCSSMNTFKLSARATVRARNNITAERVVMAQTLPTFRTTSCSVCAAVMIWLTFCLLLHNTANIWKQPLSLITIHSDITQTATVS